MSKSRLEAFSDGVFSIVMTLLIFDIKVPDLPVPVSNAQLLLAVGYILPHILVYVVSFAVLSVLWINHHFLFQFFAKSVDRWLNLINLAYLLFVVFVPFSSDLLGRYPTYQLPAIIYGLNLFCIVLLSSAMAAHIRRHEELHNEELTPRLLKQARFRSLLSLSCYSLGIASTFIYAPLSMFFFLFPVVFNIIPGTLTLAEKVFGFRLE